MVKFKKTALSVVSVGLAACFSTGIAAMAVANTKNGDQASTAQADAITRVNASIDNRTADYFDNNVVYRLNENIKSNEEISVILSLNTKSTFDAYLESGSTAEFSDYLKTSSAKNLAKKNKAAGEELKKALDKANIAYKTGVGYENVISGFEVLLRAKDYYKLTNAVGNKASVIVGEVYAPAEAEVVTNEVDVYETGIFDSSSCEYQGDGVIVAVLDTGLDYTHSAFDPKNFKADSQNDAFKLETVAGKIKNLSAATTTANLKAEDVYINRKVPYAYDYADKDADVFPLDSEHGTHVAGVIAGKDDTITGVAPNAQLAIMKVFSDSNTGARTSWLLAALDDCVALGVDVINMSLGSAAGFTTQDDEERIRVVYDKVKQAGISLITAAGNENNAVTGSDKNGSNPLTSNPDSGVVGSPSTYESALSVASVGGVKTPYFIYNGEIMYYTEAATSSAKNKNFVEDVLKTVGKDSYDFEYVTIPGVGRRSDYSEGKDYYKNKIVLVKRGDTTFEEKVDIALRIMGAAGIIIYNNVSGSISMQVGADIGAVCSVTQDQGEKLAAAKTGILKISKSQLAGPFMSDFSSWGPTSDLRIKPEITAHGGEILSAVPGQAYDRLSGTSMAAPNMAGAAALIRQYVKANPTAFGLSKESSDNNDYAIDVTKRVNQLAMSTADIVRNKNGLVYAVRKQGAGLVNIGKATTAASYISTFQKDEGGSLVEMDKSKLELGDDKDKTGVYTMTFDINNVTGSSVSYNIGSIVMTEGVSTTYTSHGETTVTTDGYLLNPETELVSVAGDGSGSGNVVNVPANKSAKVTVKITLSDADKAYLNDSFKNGMYVEGYITVKAASGTSVDLSVPFLAFYGDWTEAPIFDEEYYDTHADELNDGIDAQDKLMADAYATRVFGSYYSDYIAALGTYPFVQNPAAAKIAANKEHIALSNYEDEGASALNKINSIGAGLLRNVKDWKLTIVEDSTGKEIWSKEGKNQRKSSTSGITVYQSNMKVDFSVADFNLKNNTKYTVTVETYIDYGKKEEQNNARNTFTFPLYIDFEAPIVTGVDYRTEYDKSTKKTRLYADVNIYDNHYAMAVQFGQVVEAPQGSDYNFTMNSFGKYLTPVYSSYNSTTKATIELTDYVEQIKESKGVQNNNVVNNNSFIATCYDYAMNFATYEIRLPDEVLAMYFSDDRIDNGTINLNVNETLDLTTILNVFPADTWKQVLDFKSDSAIVEIVNQTAFVKAGGGQNATITATGKDANGKTVSASVKIHVLDKGEAGYKKYDPPQVNKASVIGYETLKAFYEINNTDRDIGSTGGSYYFGNEYNLSMYPSESVKLRSEVDSYFPNTTTLKYTSTRPEIASVDEDGVILAKSKGNATINVNAQIVTDKGLPTEKTSTYFVGTVSITVKDPYTTNSIYLMSYRGNGGTVDIPGDRGITTIQSYAFSNYKLIEKDLSAGDVIDDEEPYYTKQTYIGEDTIEKIVIPDGVTTIEAYAFAKLTALKEVVLPGTLTKIGVGAFYGCKNLTKINLENVQFINEKAFMGCTLEGVRFNKIVAIGSYAFGSEQSVKNQIGTLTLPETAQSLDSGAFYDNPNLSAVRFEASRMKFGESVFENCTKLNMINTVNAAVIPERAFYRCAALKEVTLGKDVAVIGEEAFAGTGIAGFKLAAGSNLRLGDGGKFVYKENTLILVAPQCGNTIDFDNEEFDGVTSVASGAFAGNTSVNTVTGSRIVKVEAYAFANCTNLTSVSFPNLKEVEEYAFYNASKLSSMTIRSTTGGDDIDQIGNLEKIGDWAFALTALEEVKIRDGAEIGEYAFAACKKLRTVTVGDNVTIGTAAFFAPADNSITDFFKVYAGYDYTVAGTTYAYYRYNLENVVLSDLTELTVGSGVTIGEYAFRNNAKLTTVTLGEGAKIGAYAFYDAMNITSVDLSKAVEIGEAAFSGSRLNDVRLVKGTPQFALEYEVGEDGEAVAVGYKYSYFAPKIKQADLSGLEQLGMGIFAFNPELTEVTLPEKLTEIPDYSFEYCSALEKIDIPESVTKVGAFAFVNTGVAFELGGLSFTEVGAFAFAGTPIKTVGLSDKGSTVGDSAFEGCVNLTTVANLDKAAEIGAWAFAATSVAEADLSGAVTVGDFAFGISALKKVTLGSGLKELGENPFFGCAIESFAKTVTEAVDENFPDLKVEREIATYDVNESKTIKVIDNVLYTLVPNGGLQLVCYPAGVRNGAYTVEENTVRIGARAFWGAPLMNVTLPRSLKSVGDKAFYRCERLTTVIFNGYTAPCLEEEFDESYMTYYNLPLKGEFMGYEGLGISDYYMWNSSGASNFYYGANFVTRIGYFGEAVPKLVMVSPANGTGYDTFIFGQYFDTFVPGSNAITDNTLQVIEMIASLSANITLNDKAAVEAARRAYEALPNLEQKALVTNYSKLTGAESTIKFLENRLPKPDTPDTNGDENNGSVNALGIAGFTVAGILLIALAGLTAYMFFGKKKMKSDESETTETVGEDSADNDNKDGE